MRRFKRYSKDEKKNCSLYMASELFNKLDKLAEKNNQSLNSLIVEILEGHIVKKKEEDA